MEDREPVDITKYRIWQPLLFSLMVTLGMLIGIKLSDREGDFGLIEKVTQAEPMKPGRVEEVLRFIESKYVDEIEEEELLEEALIGILGELDPHSIYIPPNKIDEVNDQMNGSYMGIGIETVFFRDSLIVTQVLPESPAYHSGISKFDIILSVDDSLTSGTGKDYESIKHNLTGFKGDTLHIELLRPGIPDHLTKSVEISDVTVRSADIAFMVDDSIGYIKIKRFNSQVYREFMESLEMLSQNESFRHLIVDVRQNPGGYLPETTNILSQLFKEKGLLLVYTQGKNNRLAEYRSTGKTFFNVDKIAVLTDEGSASGSEIMAGAIQDWDRGIIVGRRTFGKGLVQEQYNLKNGGAIRLTVARYFTPSGRSIQRSYEDHDIYNQFVERRWSNGELLSKDSIPLADTARYYTKRLNRVVFGGGGIIPDIFVPVDSSFFTNAYSMLAGHVPSFIYDYVVHNQKRFPEDFNDFKLEEPRLNQLLDALLHFFRKQNGKEMVIGLENVRESLKQRIESSLVRQLYGDLFAAEWMSKYDQHIFEATKYIREKELFADLN